MDKERFTDMEILSQPDVLSLSGNIKDFLIASSEIVRLRLYRGGELLLDNRYTLRFRVRHRGGIFLSFFLPYLLRTALLLQL